MSSVTKLVNWVDARFPLTRMWNEQWGKYIAPKNFNFWYYFGSLATLVLVIQIVSGIFLMMVPIFAALLLPALAAAKDKARQINCMSNEKQLALAAKIYAGNNNNHYPPAATWCDAIKTNVLSGNVFDCPAVNSTDLNSTNRCDYAFNAKLDGVDADKIDPQTVMIFESDTGWNAHGGLEIASTHRHRNFLNVAFADGHVERVAETGLSSLRWDP